LLGLLVLALLGLIPIAGPIVAGLAAVLGLGAVLRMLRARLRPVAEA
jgi:hypothetical protein